MPTPEPSEALSGATQSEALSGAPQSEALSGAPQSEALSGAPQGEALPTADSNETSTAAIRLQKVLSQAGFGSRRKCDDLIAAGQVAVNGHTAALGQRVDPTSDVVTVDGVVIAVHPGLVYYLLNKPAGVVTTASDPQGRPVVLDELPAEPRVFSVGRLDMDTEGVLLLTNDGDLAHRLTHPSYGVTKSYLVYLDRDPTPADLRRWREGVELSDGMTAPAKASVPEPRLLRLVVHEGRNRLVRRMCQHLGYEVLRLVRSNFGPLTVGKLKPGQWRELTVQEVRALEQAAGRDLGQAAGRQPNRVGSRQPSQNLGRKGSRQSSQKSRPNH